MRILVIGKFYAEGFALHISETFRGMGHVVTKFEPDVRDRPGTGTVRHPWTQGKRAVGQLSSRVPAIRSIRARRLWHLAEDACPDLILLCHDSFLWPGELRELKERTGAALTLWFPDSIAGFGRAYFMNAPYDAIFFKDPYIVETLRRTLDVPVYYLPECFNPLRHRLNDPASRGPGSFECDIATAGNLHAYRVAFFKQLSGYDVKVWGNPPPLWLELDAVSSMYTGRYVADHEKASAFRHARIVVNNLHPSEVWGVNARTFEVAGIGGFQLLDWRPGLAQLFEDGRELVSFRDMADLKGKLNYFLEHEEERQTIARAGMERAHREHTYAHRLALLLDTVSGKATGFPMPGCG